MLESKVDTGIEYNLDINKIQIWKNLRNEALKTSFLFTPEDSSHPIEEAPCDMACYQPGGMRDVGKTVFWLTVSVIVPIVLGRLF